MEPAPPNRRRLGPTPSLPSTAEEQAQRHGIPSEISNALQGNLSMRIRQAISSGRDSSFGRTQSQPVFAPSSSGFATHDQIMREAQSIIHKDDLRRRELRPYGSGDSVNALDLAGGRGGSPERKNRRLKFGADGEVEMEEDGSGGFRQKERVGREDWGFSQGKKRVAGDDDAESDTGTEVDEDEGEPDLDPSGSVSGSTIDEFPPVFTSPAISHPALAQGEVKGRMLPPQTARLGGTRQMRGLPGRALGKTMSAPVRLGGGIEVEMAEQELDGFDVSEWAGQTDF